MSALEAVCWAKKYFQLSFKTIVAVRQKERTTDRKTERLPSLVIKTFCCSKSQQDVRKTERLFSLVIKTKVVQGSCKDPAL